MVQANTFMTWFFFTVSLLVDERNDRLCCEYMKEDLSGVWEEQGDMANLNWGTGEQRHNIVGNKGI